MLAQLGHKQLRLEPEAGACLLQHVEQYVMGRARNRNLEQGGRSSSSLCPADGEGDDAVEEAVVGCANDEEQPKRQGHGEMTRCGLRSALQPASTGQVEVHAGWPEPAAPAPAGMRKA